MTASDLAVRKYVNRRCFRQIVLRPTEKGSGGPDLRWIEHMWSLDIPSQSMEYPSSFGP